MENERDMNNPTTGRSGFQLVQDPIVPSREAAAAPDAEMPATYGTDRVCAIARDPGSLFVYWDVNWPRLFALAGLSSRPVHLRVYRGDGKVDSTRQINPFRGHCYVEVAMPDSVYSCELGCFQDTKWKGLVRSGRTVTPRAGLSEDLSAIFATLPLHLSFERLLDIFNETEAERETLALSVAELQKTARETEAEPPGGQRSSDLATLIASASAMPAPPRSEEERAKWDDISRRLAAEADLGGSSAPNE